MELRRMPYFQQSKEKRNCGAACMAMLLHYYKMRGKVPDITTEITENLSDGMTSCRNYLIVQYALKRGLNCSIVSCKDIKTFIPFCLEMGIEMFVSYHLEKDKPYGHFSLVTNFQDNKVFLNNPYPGRESGENECISVNELEERMRCLGDGDEITCSNVVSLFSQPSQNLDIKYCNSNGHRFPVFSCTLDKINLVVDPYKDRWIPVTKIFASDMSSIQ